ncbi:TorF family putative porin [Acinetobacter puyangensis]
MLLFKNHISSMIKSGLVLSTSLFSILSYADVSGNIGVVSDYYSRGLDQTSGVSVQGSLDYAHASGFYLGSFASNVKWYDKTGDGVFDSDYEWDFYGGYSQTIGQLNYDLGVFVVTYPNETKFNEYEIYAGLSYDLNPHAWPAILSTKVYYNPDHNSYLPDPKNQDESAWYVTAQADIQLKPDLTLTPQIGYAFGDALDQNRVGGLDKFINYSLTLNKAFKDGFSASFAYVGTDIDDQDNKIVLGLKKSFDF